MSRTLVLYIKDPLERAGSTFVQAFVVLALPFLSGGAAVRVADIPWLSLVDQAGAAGILSIATSILTFKVPNLGAKADFILRLIKTFLQAFFGIIIAAHITSAVHAPWETALLTAIPVTAGAFLKGLAAMGLPGTPGASLIKNVHVVDVTKLPPPVLVEDEEAQQRYLAEIRDGTSGMVLPSVPSMDEAAEPTVIPPRPKHEAPES